jgi:hypothetical protein
MHCEGKGLFYIVSSDTGLVAWDAVMLLERCKSKVKIVDRLRFQTAEIGHSPRFSDGSASKKFR